MNALGGRGMCSTPDESFLRLLRELDCGSEGGWELRECSMSAVWSDSSAKLSNDEGSREPSVGLSGKDTGVTFCAKVKVFGSAEGGSWRVRRDTKQHCTTVRDYNSEAGGSKTYSLRERSVSSTRREVVGIAHYVSAPSLIASPLIDARLLK